MNVPSRLGASLRSSQSLTSSGSDISHFQLQDAAVDGGRVEFLDVVVGAQVGVDEVDIVHERQPVPVLHDSLVVAVPIEDGDDDLSGPVSLDVRNVDLGGGVGGLGHHSVSGDELPSEEEGESHGVFDLVLDELLDESHPLPLPSLDGSLLLLFLLLLAVRGAAAIEFVEGVGRHGRREASAKGGGVLHGQLGLLNTSPPAPVQQVLDRVLPVLGGGSVLAALLLLLLLLLLLQRLEPRRRRSASAGGAVGDLEEEVLLATLRDAAIVLEGERGGGGGGRLVNVRSVV